jgi:hypothetical protein
VTTNLRAGWTAWGTRELASEDMWVPRNPKTKIGQERSSISGYYGDPLGGACRAAPGEVVYGFYDAPDSIGILMATFDPADADRSPWTLDQWKQRYADRLPATLRGLAVALVVPLEPALPRLREIQEGDGGPQLRFWARHARLLAGDTAALDEAGDDAFDDAEYDLMTIWERLRAAGNAPAIVSYAESRVAAFEAANPEYADIKEKLTRIGRGLRESRDSTTSTITGGVGRGPKKDQGFPLPFGLLPVLTLLLAGGASFAVLRPGRPLLDRVRPAAWLVLLGVVLACFDIEIENSLVPTAFLGFLLAAAGTSLLAVASRNPLAWLVPLGFLVAAVAQGTHHALGHASPLPVRAWAAGIAAFGLPILAVCVRHATWRACAATDEEGGHIAGWGVLICALAVVGLLVSLAGTGFLFLPLVGGLAWLLARTPRREAGWNI